MSVTVTVIDNNAIINVSTDTLASQRAVQAALDAEAAALLAEAAAVQTGLDVIASGQNKTDAETAANTSTQQAILSAAARDDSEGFANDAAAAKIAAEDAQDNAEGFRDEAGVSASTALAAAQSIESSIQALGSISGTVDIDLTLGTLITATLTGTTTLTFSGLPPSTRETAFTLRFAGIFQINLPSGTKYANGIAPTPSGSLYELPCAINNAGELIVYGSINNITTR